MASQKPQTVLPEEEYLEVSIAIFYLKLEKCNILLYVKFFSYSISCILFIVYVYNKFYLFYRLEYRNVIGLRLG